MSYSHTQRGSIWILLLVLSIVEAAVAVTAASMGEHVLAIIMAGASALFCLLAACFKTLTVSDGGDSLNVAFGPIPLFRTRIRFADISAATPGESSFIDGWGIHYIPGRGWTYNLSGYQCVVLTVKGRTVRIGTDDATNLARFVQSKIRT